MARPGKQGLEYFPLDVYLDDKYKFIQIKFGLEGFGILIKLLQKIYSNSYWCKFSDDELLIFSDENRIDPNKVMDIITEALNRDIYNKDLFEKYKILTSKGIQRRYKEIVKRRKEIELIAEYLLIDDINGVIVDINNSKCIHDDDILQTECKQDDDNNEQKKEKGKRKERETESEIFSLRSKYSSLQLQVIDSFINIIKGNRSSNQVADSVLIKIYKEFENYPINQVMSGLSKFIDNDEYHHKGEKYAIGIIRNTEPSEPVKIEKKIIQDENPFLNRRLKHGS